MAKITQEQKDSATTQEHIPVATVRDGIVVLKNGGLRAVLLVGAINFSLKSEQEQNSIIFQYQSFINSLTFPVQILIQSRIMDLTNYLRSLSDQLKSQTNDLLIEMTESYIDFISGLIQDASIMNKRFYIIIPVEPLNLAPKGGKKIASLTGKKTQDVTYSDKDFDHYRQELLEHAQTVAGGLSAIGLQVAVLNTQQVVELLYTSYNPEEGLTEKLTEVEDLEAEVIKEDPSIAQQQMIENVFKQRAENMSSEDAKKPEINLNIAKTAPPILGGPTPNTNEPINTPQNTLSQTENQAPEQVPDTTQTNQATPLITSSETAQASQAPDTTEDNNSK